MFLLHFLFRLFDIGLDNLLAGEEVPHATSVELISKWVEERVEDGIRLRYHGEHLQADPYLNDRIRFFFYSAFHYFLTLPMIYQQQEI